MSTPIETAYIYTYNGNIEALLQQRLSKLRPYVTEESIEGEEKFFDQIGPVKATKRKSEFSDVEPTQSPLQRRRCVFETYDRSELVGELSQMKMIADPTAAYTQNSVAALNRTIDEIIVNAAFATAWTGKDGTTAVPWPASQVIPDGGTGLTIAKMLQAKEMLDAAENDEGEERVVAVTSKQISTLLNTTEVKNADYNTVRALAAGQINTFLGFKFVRYEGLLSAGTVRRLPCFVKTGIKLGVAKNIITSADWVPMKRAYLLYAGMSMGATRMEEKKVVEIQVQE